MSNETNRNTRQVIIYTRADTDFGTVAQREECEKYLATLNLTPTMYFHDTCPKTKGVLREQMSNLLHVIDAAPDGGEPHIVVMTRPHRLDRDTKALNTLYGAITMRGEIHFASCPAHGREQAYFEAYLNMLVSIDGYAAFDPEVAHQVRTCLNHPHPPLPEIWGEATAEAERGVYHRQVQQVREDMGMMGPNEQKVRARIKAEQKPRHNNGSG